MNAVNETAAVEGTPKESDLLEVAGILGVTPDEADEMSPSEVATALGALKVQGEDQNVGTHLLTDAARID